MSAVLAPITLTHNEMRQRRALVTVEVLAGSQMPFVVSKKSTGQQLGRFETSDKVDEYLTTVDIEKLRSKPKRGPRRT